MFRIRKRNTLRNQILVAFLSAMIIVLLCVGVITYHLVSTLLKDNAEEEIQQTAVQANGRIETLYQQLNAVTRQLATDADVQQLLLEIVRGQSATFQERQSLMKVANTYITYSDGISAFEIYTNEYNRLFPLDEAGLLEQVDLKWVRKADRAEGRLVWIGRTKRDPNHFLAIRRISLIDRSFSSGGYLLTRVQTDYFDLEQEERRTGFMVLADRHFNPISSNYHGDIDIRTILSNDQSTLSIDDKEYSIVTQQSDLIGWTLIILTPVSTITEGISVLRTAIILSGVAGFIIFLIFSYSLSTMITRPVLRLTRAMRRARLGMLQPNPGTSSTVEINELNKTYNQLVENNNYLIEAVYEKELIRSRAELKALQAQINPHFLYNTLDALYWSLEEKDEEELAEHVVAMSELFRYTISDPKKNGWVTVSEELEHIERYLQLMKMRYGNRLAWHISVPEECQSVKMPKLLIQPLVENAILHGIGWNNGKGIVTVTVAWQDGSDHLVIEVEDDGAGMDEQTIRAVRQSMRNDDTSALKAHGIAIANVNKRLKLYYDRHFGGLAVESKQGEGTCIRFEIPAHGGNQ